MNAEDVLRFLDHEARRCMEVARQRAEGKPCDVDTMEMHLLWYPPMMKLLKLKPMDDGEARAFQWKIHEDLIGKNAPEFAEI